jgi:hypothetical protein
MRDDVSILFRLEVNVHRKTTLWSRKQVSPDEWQNLYLGKNFGPVCCDEIVIITIFLLIQKKKICESTISQKQSKNVLGI